MVDLWMEELKERYPAEELERWMTDNNISNKEPAKDYCKIYEKRYKEINEDDGFAYLESVMEGKEPSCGYSFLAQILAKTEHRIVITTNFDSLTEDALFMFTDKKPLVVGHESLSTYIKPLSSRPLVVKVHHDLLYSPQSDSKATSKLAEGMVNNLRAIFTYFTPLVIGYGGNDGSLMGFLDQLNEIKGGLFWFYRNEKEVQDEKIQKLVKKFDGNFVKIHGFDELMIQLGDKLEMKLLDKDLTSVAERRAKSYRKQFDEINKLLQETGDVETSDALSEIVSREPKTWWTYQLAADAEKSAKVIEEIYKEGMKRFPNSHELMNNYANFLADNNQAHDKAESLYKKAIELESTDTYYLGNYAAFLFQFRHDYDKSEEYLKKAIAIDSKDADNLGNYALLKIHRGDFVKAKELIDEAFRCNKRPENLMLSLELWFYAYAIFPKDYPQSRSKIENYLAKGVQSLNWPLNRVLAIAKKLKHPHYKDLAQVLKRINEPQNSPNS